MSCNTNQMRYHISIRKIIMFICTLHSVHCIYSVHLIIDENIDFWIAQHKIIITTVVDADVVVVDVVDVVHVVHVVHVHY